MALEVDQDSDVDSWVLLDSDGDDGLSSGCITPDCRSDDEDPGLVLILSSARRRRARSPPPCPDDADADDDDAEGLYDPGDAEEAPQQQPHPPTAPGPRPLSGLFYNTLDGRVDYAAFDPVLCWPGKVLLADPAFSACGEQVTLLASTRGLVCLHARLSGVYIVANPATGDRVPLPRHSCDHAAYGAPAVVIAFEDDTTARTTCCADHCGHYHVVVAFPLGHGVYAYESFSSRTWQWTVGAAVDAVGQVVSASGVGALGRAFWRTTVGYILCYNPATRAADLISAPQEVLQWPYWELGEMNHTLAVTCMDERVNEVVVINLHLEPREDGAVDIFKWSFAAYFEGGCLRNCDRVQLLRSQGPDVVMWNPTLELVVAMDTEGRTTRTVGPLSGQQYYSDFIPYVTSSTGITRVKAGAGCMFTAAADEHKVPNLG